jgi:hypothetical protein
MFRSLFDLEYKHVLEIPYQVSKMPKENSAAFSYYECERYQRVSIYAFDF